MVSRRRFLQATAAAALIPRPGLAAAASVDGALGVGTSARGQAAVRGANDRVRLGVIGTGTRGTMVGGFFLKHPDCTVVAACDVFKERLDKAVGTFGAGGGKVDAYDDYRRILDRKDVDAVLIATPDHWHSPITIEACAAGKDVYVEKPVSNAIEPAQKMVAAARQYQRIVQVGLQQRQGEHFKEAHKLIQDGLLGKVTHVVMQFPGAYTMPPEPSQAPPPDFNWDRFQGPAERRPYKPSRQRRWRTYYDYGGGLVTDWGVHLVDVAHWYLNLDASAPTLTSASAQYVNVENPEHDQVPDAFTVSWQYEHVVMSFTNAVMTSPDFGLQGNYFYGPKGCLQINRAGYQIRPGQARRLPDGTTDKTPPIEARVRKFEENYNNDPDTLAHARNFLDCVKSRQKPVADIEIGFHSSLPCLLGILAIRQGRSFSWDGTKANPT